MLAVFLDSFMAGCFWPRTWPSLSAAIFVFYFTGFICVEVI